jgi:sterol desaturase/sphingolipid hydroxylase (fatty acid hydroxylase superfamily)
MHFWWLPYGSVLLLMVAEKFWPLQKRETQPLELPENLFWMFFLEYGFPALLVLTNSIGFVVVASHFSFHPLKMNPVLEFLTIIILIDFFRYWGHRFLHTQPFMWEIHKLHHSSKWVGTLSAWRGSWVEDLIFSNALSWLLFVFGFNPRMIGFIGMIYNFQGQIIHSNLNLKIGSLASKVFVDPKFHHWHHARQGKSQYGQNYGVILSVWDGWFGTHHYPDENAREFGFVNDEVYPKNVLRRIIYPLDHYALSFIIKLSGRR